MDIQGFDFNLASRIDAERNPTGEIWFWTPKKEHSSDGRPFHEYGRGPFAKLQLRNVPQGKGVYAIVRNDNEIMYVGSSTDSLSKRWGKGVGCTSISKSDCFKGGRPTFCRLNHLIYTELNSGNRMALWVVENEDPKPIKVKILGARLPAWNINA